MVCTTWRSFLFSHGLHMGETIQFVCWPVYILIFFKDWMLNVHTFLSRSSKKDKGSQLSPVAAVFPSTVSIFSKPLLITPNQLVTQWINCSCKKHFCDNYHFILACFVICTFPYQISTLEKACWKWTWMHCPLLKYG